MRAYRTCLFLILFLAFLPAAGARTAQVCNPGICWNIDTTFIGDRRYEDYRITNGHSLVNVLQRRSVLATSLADAWKYCALNPYAGLRPTLPTLTAGSISVAFSQDNNNLRANVSVNNLASSDGYSVSTFRFLISRTIGNTAVLLTIFPQQQTPEIAARIDWGVDPVQGTFQLPANLDALPVNLQRVIMAVAASLPTWFTTANQVTSQMNSNGSPVWNTADAAKVVGPASEMMFSLPVATLPPLLTLTCDLRPVPYTGCQETGPLYQFAEFLMKYGAEYLVSGSDNAAQSIISTLRSWAANNALMTYPGYNPSTPYPAQDDTRIRYTLNNHVITLAVVWGMVRDHTLVSPTDRALIDSWAGKLLAFSSAPYNGFSGDPNSHDPNNHGYLKLGVIMAWAIVSGSDDGFAHGVERFYMALNQLNADGSFPYEASRGSCATSYQALAVANLITLAELAASQGYDLYSLSVNGVSIHSAVKFLLDAVDDPAVILKYAAAGGLCNLPPDSPQLLDGVRFFSSNNLGTTAFIEQYIARFPDSPLSARMRNLIQPGGLAAHRPIGTFFAGGNTTCYAATDPFVKFTLTGLSGSVASTGSAGSLLVKASSPTYGWNAESSANWLTVNAKSGTGSGVIDYSVATNPGPSLRSASITAGNQVFLVTQLGCSTSVSSAAAINADASGGTGTLNVTADAGCRWNASSAVSWITFNVTSGTGNGTVRYTVAANKTAARNSAILVAGYRIPVTQPSAPGFVCSYALSLGGQALSATGGSGSVAVTTPEGCSWNVSGAAGWVSFSSVSGADNGTVAYTVAANSGGARSNVITIGGVSFTIEQAAASIPGLSLLGSMPHIAAQDVWTTTFTLVNKSTNTATARLDLLGDPGAPLSLPLALPQQVPATGPIQAASLDRALAANASLVIDTAGPRTPPVQVGSAQLSATGALDGFAIFRLIPGAQEAVVPLETRNASSYVLAFDQTGGVVLGVAVQNVANAAANIPVVIRDDTGAVISPSNAAVSLSAGGHTSFVLSQQFSYTANKRGTITFSTPSGGRISVLGIRTTPVRNTLTLTTIPALANIGTNGGSIAHIATGGGWQTTFVLVNTGPSTAQATLRYFATGTGAPLALPLTFPQTGSSNTANFVTQSIAAGASLIVQSAGPANQPVTTGSAQLTTSGNVGGFVIFRYNPNGQEAVVPLESRTFAAGYLIAFDNTSGTATGIAVNNAAATAASVPVPVILRDDAGNQIATDTLTLAANGHTAFTLGVDKFPVAAGKRGTIEFVTPVGGSIGALGIRIPPALTFTTLPALAK